MNKPIRIFLCFFVNLYLLSPLNANPPLSPTQLQNIRSEIDLLWNEHIKRTDQTNEMIRQKKHVLPIPSTIVSLTIVAGTHQIPVSIITTTSSLHPHLEKNPLYTGLVAPLSTLPQNTKYLSVDKKFLLYPNTPAAQSALSLGKPSCVPPSKVFANLKNGQNILSQKVAIDPKRD